MVQHALTKLPNEPQAIVIEIAIITISSCMCFVIASYSSSPTNPTHTHFLPHLHDDNFSIKSLSNSITSKHAYTWGYIYELKHYIDLFLPPNASTRMYSLA